MKYITWNSPIVSGSEQTYIEMQTTKVIVIDVEEFDEKGAVFFNAEKVQVL